MIKFSTFILIIFFCGFSLSIQAQENKLIISENDSVYRPQLISPTITDWIKTKDFFNQKHLKSLYENEWVFMGYKKSGDKQLTKNDSLINQVFTFKDNSIVMNNDTVGIVDTKQIDLNTSFITDQYYSLFFNFSTASSLLNGKFKVIFISSVNLRIQKEDEDSGSSIFAIFQYKYDSDSKVEIDNLFD